MATCFDNILLPLMCMVFFFFIKKVNMQIKYADMQDSDVYMQHKYADMQKVCNQLRIKQKKSNIAQT